MSDTNRKTEEQTPSKGMTVNEHRTVIAGFGGQGILTLGKLLCMSALDEGKMVTYLPSYGSEVRGGTANCQVVISPGPVCSPLVEKADSLIILNELSWEKFADLLKPDAPALLNSSGVTAGPGQLPAGPNVLAMPAAEMAAHLGNVQVTNMVMLGAFLTVRPLVTRDAALAALESLLGRRKKHLLDVNVTAFDEGARFARQAGLA